MSKQILLADGSSAARKSIEQILGTADYQIITAEDGRSAMEQIKGKHPHLVLAHAILPEIDGYEVCRLVKESPDTSHIPVLLLTGTFEPFDINRAKEVRYDGFVTKPLDGAELRALVERCIGNAVYPAADPVPEEEPDPERPLETETETAESTLFPVASPDTETVSGSDAMLDRIFPDEPREDFSPDGETVTGSESSDDDLFALVDSADSSNESEAEPDQSEATGSTAFGVWGDSQQTGTDHTLVEEAETSVENEEAPEDAAEDEKPEVPDENSDLSWFLRKYEEKQQGADIETEELPPEPLSAAENEVVPVPLESVLTTSDSFSVETDDDVPAEDGLTVDTENESLAVEETDTGNEVVEPLAVDLGALVTDQPPPPVDLDDQQLERISRRVVELLSESVVRDVAWEAVPEIAERLIRERIRDIEAEAETSD